MIDMNMDIQHIMEACDKSTGASNYNGKREKKAKDQTVVDPVDNEGCCKKEASIFDGAFQALDEFKGDAELQNRLRGVHDKMSGNHEYSSQYKANKNAVRDNLSGRTSSNGSVHNMNQKRSEDLDKIISRAMLDRAEHTKRDGIMRDEKAKHESASIFDTLFDQV